MTMTQSPADGPSIERLRIAWRRLIDAAEAAERSEHAPAPIIAEVAPAGADVRATVLAGVATVPDAQAEETIREVQL